MIRLRCISVVVDTDWFGGVAHFHAGFDARLVHIAVKGLVASR